MPFKINSTRNFIMWNLTLSFTIHYFFKWNYVCWKFSSPRPWLVLCLLQMKPINGVIIIINSRKHVIGRYLLMSWANSSTSMTNYWILYVLRIITLTKYISWWKQNFQVAKIITIVTIIIIFRTFDSFRNWIFLI